MPDLFADQPEAWITRWALILNAGADDDMVEREIEALYAELGAQDFARTLVGFWRNVIGRSPNVVSKLLAAVDERAEAPAIIAATHLVPESGLRLVDVNLEE